MRLTILLGTGHKKQIGSAHQSVGAIAPMDAPSLTPYAILLHRSSLTRTEYAAQWVFTARRCLDKVNVYQRRYPRGVLE
jgi:hypothetical protein